MISTFDLQCLIKKPNCFKSSNPPRIDLVLKNKKELDVIEVGISVHYSFIVTAFKNQLLKGNAISKLYRDYSSFNIDQFKEVLGNNLKNNSITEYSPFKKFFWKCFMNMHSKER